MSLAWIGLGANLGRPEATLTSALLALDALPSTRLKAVSPAYWTPPWGDTEQPEFLNAVACVRTELAPRELLRALQDVELRLGRERGQRRWGPRVIDLDVLLVDDQIEESPELTLPHPRLQDRAFVLVPLSDLAPDLTVPGQGRVSELLDALPDEEMGGIRPASGLAWR